MLNWQQTQAQNLYDAGGVLSQFKAKFGNAAGAELFQECQKRVKVEPAKAYCCSAESTPKRSQWLNR